MYHLSILIHPSGDTNQYFIYIFFKISKKCANKQIFIARKITNWSRNPHYKNSLLWLLTENNSGSTNAFYPLLFSRPFTSNEISGSPTAISNSGAFFYKINISENIKFIDVKKVENYNIKKVEITILNEDETVCSHISIRSRNVKFPRQFKF